MRIIPGLIGMMAASAIVAGPAQAKELTIAVQAEVTSMDPHFHNLGPNNGMMSHIYDALVMQDEKQQLTPGLATSWKPISDTVWEFKLRQGVKFHDGTDFNADDVIATWERAPNVKNSPSSFGLYTRGKTIKKIDDHTIHIITEGPWPLMPNDVSTVMIISDEHQNAETSDFNDGSASVGTGRYKQVEYVPSDRVVLERNEDWWGDKPVWTKVTVKPIKSAPSRVAALLAGDVDMIDVVPTVDIARLKQNKDLVLSQGVSNRVIYLHMDRWREDSPFIKGTNGKNPFNDKRVRKAISMAINRDAIVERVMEGVAIKAGQLLPEGFFGVSPNIKPMDYDPKRAKELLAEAGYPDGFELTLHGPNDRYVNDAKIAEAVGQMLTRIGIKTEVVTMPRSVYFSRASRGADGEPEFSFFLVGWGSGTGEASAALRSLLTTYDKSKGFGAANRGRYSNPEVDRLVVEALGTVDDPKRAELLGRATEVAMEDVGIIPLHYQVNTWASRKGIAYLPRTDERTTAYSAVEQ